MSITTYVINSISSEMLIILFIGVVFIFMLISSILMKVKPPRLDPFREDWCGDRWS